MFSQNYYMHETESSAGRIIRQTIFAKILRMQENARCEVFYSPVYNENLCLSQPLLIRF